MLKLAAENERLKQQLEEMTMRLEAVERRSKAIDVHTERVKEEKRGLRRPGLAGEVESFVSVGDEDVTPASSNPGVAQY